MEVWDTLGWGCLIVGELQSIFWSDADFGEICERFWGAIWFCGNFRCNCRDYRNILKENWKMVIVICNQIIEGLVDGVYAFTWWQQIQCELIFIGFKYFSFYKNVQANLTHNSIKSLLSLAKKKKKTVMSANMK